MSTVSFPGVEIAAVGKWHASLGDGHITEEDLRSMADTFGQPGFDQVPLKLGHLDSRFQDAAGRPPVTEDGSPAFGWLSAVRVSPDGKRLLADLVGIPSKLAEMLPSAYRRRSVEMVRGMRVAGRVHRAVLTGLALLGVTAPAVKNLADVAAMFAAQPLHFAAGPTPAASPDDRTAAAVRTYAPTPELVRVELTEADPDTARAISTFIR